MKRFLCVMMLCSVLCAEEEELEDIRYGCCNSNEILTEAKQKISEEYLILNDRILSLNLEETSTAQYYYMRGKRDAYSNSLIFLGQFNVLE